MLSSIHLTPNSIYSESMVSRSGSSGYSSGSSDESCLFNDDTEKDASDAIDRGYYILLSYLDLPDYFYII